MSNETIFDCINAINYKKRDFKYNKSIGNAYLLLLWFSHDKSLLPILNKINKYVFSLSDDVIYNYMYYSIPSGKRFLKWVKKDKTEGEESLEKELTEYNLSKREIMLYNKFAK